MTKVNIHEPSAPDAHQRAFPECPFVDKPLCTLVDSTTETMVSEAIKGLEKCNPDSLQQRHGVAEPTKGTCEWISTDETFTKWVSRCFPALCVQAPSGVLCHQILAVTLPTYDLLSSF